MRRIGPVSGNGGGELGRIDVESRNAGKKKDARRAAKNDSTANGPSLSGEVLVAVLERGEKKWTRIGEFRSGAFSEISVHWRSFAVLLPRNRLNFGK